MLPILNILLYTDYPHFFHETPLSTEGGLSDLEAFVKDKTKQFVDVHFRLVSRHGTDKVSGAEINAEQMITEELLTDIHELWVFPFRRTNKADEPHNELEQNEIHLLNEFIQQGKIGILLSGDHSQSTDGSNCDNGEHENFSSLGRALGENFPFAGLIRDWKGPPTNCIELPFDQRDNFNTIEGFDPNHLDTEGFQFDSIAQTIILPQIGGQPHRLFTYVDSNNQIQEINKLPDHAHEGRVLNAGQINEVWPPNLQRPIVAAQGRDKRFPNESRTETVVAAFDGDPAGMSRIVVDSSFHHYLNDNLSDIPSRNSASNLPDPDSDLDKIAHFFGNLALWLAPRSIRNKIKFDILLSLARHIDVVETLNLSDARLGRVARGVLTATIGPGKLQWLFSASPFEATDSVDEFFSSLFLDDEKSSPLARIVKPELPLGIALRICDEYLTRHRISDVTRMTSHAELWQLLQSTFLISMQVAQAEVAKLSARSLSTPTPSFRIDNISKGENVMARKCKTDWNSWRNPLQPSTDPDKPNDGKILVLEDDNGNLKGKHQKGGHEYTFTGTCKEGPHRMSIDTDEGFTYSGIIFPLNDERFVIGTRKPTNKGRDQKPPDGKNRLDDEEIWIAVKTT